MLIMIFLVGVVVVIFFSVYPPTQEAKKYRIRELGQKTRKAISDLTNNFVTETLKNSYEKEKNNVSQ